MSDSGPAPTGIAWSDHEKILKQTLQLCEIQLYQRFQKDMAATRKEAVKAAAFALSSMKTHTLRDINSLSDRLTGVPSTPRRDELLASTSDTLESLSKEHDTLEEDMHRELLRYMQQKQTLQEKYETLYEEAMHRKQQASEAQLQHLLTSASYSDLQSQQLPKDFEPYDSGASSYFTSTAAVSNEASNVSIQHHRMRPDPHSHSYPHPHPHSLPHSTSASVIDEQRKLHSRKASSQVPASRPSTAHPSTRRSALEPESGRISVGRIRPQTAKSSASSTSARSSSLRSTRASSPTTDRLSPSHRSTATSRPTSATATASRKPILTVSVDEPELPHPSARKPFIFDEGVDALISSINASLPTPRYHILPERVFGALNGSPMGRTKYSRAIAQQLGKATSKAAKALNAKLAQRESQLKARMHARNEALQRDIELMSPNSRTSFFKSNPKLEAALAPLVVAETTSQRVRKQYDAEWEATALKRALITGSKKPTPTINEKGKVIDPLTNALVAGQLNYDLLTQSPQEKFQNKLQADLEKDLAKQRAVDQHWEKQKQMKGLKVDNIALHVGSSSSVLGDVENLRQSKLALAGVGSSKSPHRRNLQSPERGVSVITRSRSVSRENRPSPVASESLKADLLNVTSAKLLSRPEPGSRLASPTNAAPRDVSDIAGVNSPNVLAVDHAPPSEELSLASSPSRQSLQSLPPLPLPLLGVEPVSHRSDWTQAELDEVDSISTVRSTGLSTDRGSITGRKESPLSTNRSGVSTIVPGVANDIELSSSPSLPSSNRGGASTATSRHRAMLSSQMEGDELAEVQPSQNASHAASLAASRRDSTNVKVSIPTARSHATELPEDGSPPAVASDSDATPAFAPSEPQELTVWRTDEKQRRVPRHVRGDEDGDDSSGVSSDDEVSDVGHRISTPAPHSSSPPHRRGNHMSSPPLSPNVLNDEAFSNMLDAMMPSQTPPLPSDESQMASHHHSQQDLSLPHSSSAPTSQQLSTTSSTSAMIADGPSSLQYTISNLRSKLARIRDVVSDLNADRNYFLREVQVMDSQAMNLKELAAKRAADEETKILGQTLQRSLENGQGIENTLPTDVASSLYTAEDHQLNLLYLRQLVYASLKEEKDLIYLCAEMQDEEGLLRAKYDTTYARLLSLTQQTSELRQKHSAAITKREKKIVKLLQQGHVDTLLQSRMMETLRLITRFYSQIHGYERSAPVATSSAGNANLPSGAEMGHPLLPQCFRCQKSLLPPEEDYQLLVRMMREKRAAIAAHTETTALRAASRPTSAVIQPTNRPVSAALSRSTFSQASLSSTTSSVKARAKESATSKQTEWQMLEQLAALSHEIRDDTHKNKSAKHGDGRTRKDISAFGLQDTRKARGRAVRDRDDAQFVGGSSLRPISATTATGRTPTTTTQHLYSQAFGADREMYRTETPAAPPVLGVEARATAKLLQQNLLAREYLHSYCDWFTHLSTGKSVCRDCKYILEANPSLVNVNGIATFQRFPVFASSESSELPSTYFAPDQSSIRFFAHRKLVPLEEVQPNLLQGMSGNKKQQQNANPASRPFSAITTRELHSSHNPTLSFGSESAASLPDSSLSESKESNSSSTSSLAASRTNAYAHREAARKKRESAEDSLSILRKMRRLLGFHPNRHVQVNKTVLFMKQKQQADNNGAANLGHIVPAPMLQSGGIAF